jgi:hypothetical protein
MQKVFLKQLAGSAIVALLMMISLSSCEKDKDGTPDVPAGDMASGSIEPGEAGGGQLITLTGSGIGQIHSIVFEKNNVPAAFQPTLNTASNLLFYVPDTASGGTQNVIFTNAKGKQLVVPFNVLAFPTVSAVSNYNFSEGTEITLTGTNLDDVSKVVFTGTTQEITIVSKARKALVLKMPATSIARAKLDITNVTGKMTTTQEFVSLSNNFQMFTDTWGPGAYNSGVQSWSWGCAAYPSTDFVKSGTHSLRVDYVDGGLSMFLGSDWGNPAKIFTDYHTPFPSFLSFWARAVGSDVTVSIMPDGGAGTFTGAGEQSVSIPAGNWTYFKIPANFLSGKFARLNIKISGSTDKTVYFDDLLWVK